jgi:hypothetical protein
VPCHSTELRLGVYAISVEVIAVPPGSGVAISDWAQQAFPDIGRIRVWPTCIGNLPH